MAVAPPVQAAVGDALSRLRVTSQVLTYGAGEALSCTFTAMPSRPLLPAPRMARGICVLVSVSIGTSSQ